MMISCKSVFGVRQSIVGFVLNQNNTKWFASATTTLISSVRKNSTDIKQKKIGIIGMGQVGIKY